MNLSCSIFLVNQSVRAVRVSYDPDNRTNNNPNRLFKTFDDSIAKDDFVVVPTHTRHGFTVCKVEEVGFRPDLDGGEKWDWIVGKVDTPTYDRLVDQEKVVLDRIGDVEYNRKKKELADAMGLASVKLTDLDLVNGNAPALPAPVGPMGHTTPEPTPSAAPVLSGDDLA